LGEAQVEVFLSGGMRRFIDAYVNRRAWGRGVRGVHRICVVKPGILLTAEEKSRKISVMGNRRSLGCSALNAFR